MPIFGTRTGRRGLFGRTTTAADPLARVRAANVTLQERLAATPAGPTLGKRALTGLQQVFEQISRPYYALTGGLKELVEGGTLGAAGREAWKGLTLKEKDEFFDVLSAAGWNPETKAGKFAKGAVGFLGAMAIDPASYVSFGTAGLAKGAIQRAITKGVQKAGQKLAPEIVEGMAEHVLRTAGKGGVKLAQIPKTPFYSGPVQEGLLGLKPARRLQIGTRIPFTGGKAVQTGVSLARPGEAATRALTALKAALPERGVLGGARKAVEFGEKVAGFGARLFTVDFDAPRRLALLGSRYRDLTRAATRVIHDDAAGLAREFWTAVDTQWQAGRRALPTLERRLSTGAMRALHGAGKAVAQGHEELRGLAKELYGLGSLRELSERQARGIEAALKHPEWGRRPAKELLPTLEGATTFAARDEFAAAASYDIMRALDSGQVERLPDFLQGFARTAKEAFDTIGADELARGILEDTRQNYFTHLLSGYRPEQAEALQAAISRWTRRAGKLAKTTRFARRRTFETFDDLERFVEHARATMPEFANLTVEKDWVKVLGTRKLAHAKVMQNYDMLAGLRAVGDDLVTDAKTAPATFVDPPIPQLGGVKVHPQVARWLADFKEPFTNISSLRSFLAVVDKGTNIWKGLATAARPGFHIRNAVSNVFNNWLGGVKDAFWYSDAARLQRAAAKGPEALAALTIQGRSGAEWWDELSRGVVGQGWLGADIGQTLAEAARAGKQAAGAGGRLGALRQLLEHPVQTGRRLGTAVEDNARIAHYLCKRMGGLDPEAALLSVKHYLFDYDELTAFERHLMKRFFPFFTWVRKNIPLQLSELVKQPGVYAKMGHLKRAAEALSEGPDEADLPDWMRRQYMIRLPWQTEGGQLYASLDLPLNDLDLPSVREVLGMLNPLLKAPIELTANVQFYSGQPLEETPGEYVEAPGYLWAVDRAVTLKPGLAPWWPALRQKLGLAEWRDPETGARELRMPARAKYKLDQIILLRDIGRVVGIAGGQEPLEKLGSPILGVGLYALTPEKARLGAEYRENEALRQELLRLESMGISVPEAGGRRRGLFSRGGGGKRRGLFSRS